MRIMVNLSDEMVRKVDKLAESIGVNRSAFCAMMIGNGVVSYVKSLEVIESIAREEIQKK